MTVTAFDNIPRQAAHTLPVIIDYYRSVSTVIMHSRDPAVASMLGQRRRRRPNIESTAGSLGQRPSAGPMPPAYRRGGDGIKPRGLQCIAHSSRHIARIERGSSASLWTFVAL